MTFESYLNNYLVVAFMIRLVASTIVLHLSASGLHLLDGPLSNL